MSYLSPGVATPSDGGRHPFTPSRAYPDDEAARGPPPAPPSRAAPRPPGGVNVTVAAALPFPQVQGDPVMWQTGVWTAFERDLAVWLDTARCTGVETVGFISFTDAVRQTMLELAKGEQVATASALMLTNDELLRLARARAARRPVEQWPALFAGPSPLAPFEAADAVGFTTVLRRVHDTLKRGGCDLRQVRGRGARAFVEMLVHERAAFYVPNPRVRLLMQLVLEMACPLSLDIPTTFTWDVYVDALASPAFSALLDAAARNQAIVTTTQLAASQRRALRAELPSLAPAAPTALPEPAATTTLRHSAPSEGAAGSLPLLRRFDGLSSPRALSGALPSGAPRPALQPLTRSRESPRREELSAGGERLCFRCGKPGHVQANCTDGPQVGSGTLARPPAPLPEPLGPPVAAPTPMPPLRFVNELPRRSSTATPTRRVSVQATLLEDELPGREHEVVLADHFTVSARWDTMSNADAYVGAQHASTLIDRGVIRADNHIEDVVVVAAGGEPYLGAAYDVDVGLPGEAPRPAALIVADVEAPFDAMLLGHDFGLDLGVGEAVVRGTDA